MSKIKTFEEACEALKISTSLPDVSALPEKHQKASTANYKLIIIAEALNEGWEPDWSNWDEYKYFPWFDMKNGSGFSLRDYDYTNSVTGVGSRLCFKTKGLALYAGKQFIDLYKDYMVISK